MISKCKAARERTNNRNELSTETTTDTISRAYSERRATSIVTRRTGFLVGTGLGPNDRGHDTRHRPARGTRTDAPTSM
jgi:hypothetical protein